MLDPLIDPLIPFKTCIKIMALMFLIVENEKQKEIIKKNLDLNACAIRCIACESLTWIAHLTL